MLLLDLPLDVVTLIISELERECDGAVFYRLSLTCRTLHTLTSHLISRHVVLRQSCSQRKQVLLWWKAHPETTSMVKSLTTMHPRDANYDFLRHFHHLRVLRFRLSDCVTHLKCPLVWDLPQTLEEIEGLVFNWSELMRILQLPKLKCLGCFAADVPYFSFRNLRESLLEKASQSALERLEIREVHSYAGCQTFNLEEMRSILTCTPHLKALRCNVPSSGYPILPSSPHAPTLDKLLDALRLTAATLTSLHLFTGVYEPDSANWRSYRIGRLNLHDFPVLRSLSASAIMLLGASDLHFNRENLYTLLPRSLETLSLYFCYETWIFYRTIVRYLSDDLRGTLHHKWSSGVRRLFFPFLDGHKINLSLEPFLSRDSDISTFHWSSYDFKRARYLGIFDHSGRERFLNTTQAEHEFSWILELALRKSEYLPNLRKVSLHEIISWHWDCLRHEKWNPPDVVREVFAQNDVDLDVHTRAAQPNSIDRIIWFSAQSF